MFKTIPLIPDIMHSLLSNLKGDSIGPEAGKLKKMTLNFESLQKLVSYCVLVYVIPN